MKITILLVVMVVAIASVEGRTYYGKRPVKQHQICPQIACTQIHIPPGCSRDTYYHHNGIRCQGCPENICGSGQNQWDNNWQNQWDNNWQNQWDDNWQQGSNRWPRVNNRQLRRDRQGGQFW